MNNQIKATIFSKTLILSLIVLPSKTAPNSKCAFSPSGCTQRHGTTFTLNYGLSVGESGGNAVASGTFDVHEVAVWSWDQALEFVATSLLVGCWMEQVDFHF